MSDLRRLKAECDIPALLMQLGYSFKRGGTHYVMCCPNPVHDDRHPSATVYESGVHCFTCGETYSPLDLIMFSRGCSVKDAIRFLWEFEGAPDWFEMPENRKKGQPSWLYLTEKERKALKIELNFSSFRNGKDGTTFSDIPSEKDFFGAAEWAAYVHNKALARYKELYPLAAENQADFMKKLSSCPCRKCCGSAGCLMAYIKGKKYAVMPMADLAQKAAQKERLESHTDIGSETCVNCLSTMLFDLTFQDKIKSIMDTCVSVVNKSKKFYNIVQHKKIAS